MVGVPIRTEEDVIPHTLGGGKGRRHWFPGRFPGRDARQASGRSRCHSTPETVNQLPPPLP